MVKKSGGLDDMFKTLTPRKLAAHARAWAGKKVPQVASVSQCSNYVGAHMQGSPLKDHFGGRYISESCALQAACPTAQKCHKDCPREDPETMLLRKQKRIAAERAEVRKLLRERLRDLRQQDHNNKKLIQIVRKRKKDGSET